MFGSYRLLAQTSIPSLTFLGKELPVADSVKDLVVIVDKHLSLNEHTSTLASELIGKLALISRLRLLFDKNILLTVINSPVFTKLFYCSSVWSGTSNSNISKLQHVRSFVTRLLSGKKKFEHVTPTLKESNLPPVRLRGF